MTAHSAASAHSSATGSGGASPAEPGPTTCKHPPCMLDECKHPPCMLDQCNHPRSAAASEDSGS